ncbi:hypothetical protein GS399_10565 [Pedobacter sp. HMF7647]|uniref:Uncharacterized protein n=1 Tax=Hufsiella arboris TaxID=2695275 RepID=A0A7K1Y9Y9_9SPHI|nr:hypothetical protein [Hufsiella arboris]MXV51413.1 hypothetical protein [Hufsiella arboris]
MKDQSINYYRIEKAITFIEQNFKRQPDLDQIAKSGDVGQFQKGRIRKKTLIAWEMARINQAG